MRKRKLGNEMKRKWKEKEIRKGDKRERKKLYLEMNEKIEERKKWLEKKYRKERRKKRGKEAGERGEVANFVLESKSCIGWDKPQAKFTIKQKQKFSMKRK